MGYEYRTRVAVVTGASSGIGRRTALDLAERGTTVVAVARRGDLLESVADACRTHAPGSVAVVTDVGNREQVEAMIAQTLHRHERIDILVNNAAIPMRVHATRLTAEHLDRAMRINFFGAAWATLAALPSMLERRHGRIINVGSVASRMASPRESAYSASKFALAGFSETLASDLDGTGVRVHLVVPGPIATEIWQKVDEPPAYRGRLFDPAIVSRAILRCVEDPAFERWAPRRLRAASLFHDLFRTAFIKGTARYDRRHVPE